MLKAMRELGLGQLALYGLHQLGLRSGYLRWATRTPVMGSTHGRRSYRLQTLLELPERDVLKRILGVDGVADLLKEADEIVDGQFRRFGDHPVPIELHPPEPLLHWSFHEQGKGIPPGMDVKMVWEPARLGWVFNLGRAYYLTGDERYVAAFWVQLERFWEANPPYLGLNWTSAQEVAIRILALAYAGQVFAPSIHSTPDRLGHLAASIANHAQRIPPTIFYAKAQNNNHLLSEAVGLVTAALALPGYPESGSWYRLGWHWFNRGIQMQIDSDGSYTQYSTNYQRLMLQLALWMNAILHVRGSEIPTLTQDKLRAATYWLAALVDPESGGVPNLGPNDGAYILPLTVCPFEDYRPVIAAASLAFNGMSQVDPGLWDEMSTWLLPARESAIPAVQLVKRTGTSIPHVVSHPGHNSRAYLRAVRFNSRPGHADQLHLDLWWRGLNLALDPGSYSYNAPEPWENALARTAVHNTLTLNGQDQMTLAGRFLWLDWAQAKILPGEGAALQQDVHLDAEHDGYRKVGITHQRNLIATDDGWSVRDRILFSNPSLAAKYLPFTTRLHWMLPDWSWEIDENEYGVEIAIQSGFGVVRLMIQLLDREKDGSGFSTLLVRAGERLYGYGEIDPTWGWTSPTYGRKIQALSFSVTVLAHHPITLVSYWLLP